MVVAPLVVVVASTVVVALVPILMLASMVVVPTIVVPLMIVAAAVVVVVIVRSVHLEPSQLMLLVCKEKLRLSFFFGHLGQDADDFNEAEGVKCCIMLLRTAQGSAFPVGHLLALTHLLVQKVLGDLSEPALVRRDANFAIVRLCVDEVCEELVKLHRWEMPCKDIQVAFEREADAETVRMGEDLREDVVEEGTGGQSHQVDQICGVLVTELQEGRSHDVKFGHCGPPF